MLLLEFGPDHYRAKGFDPDAMCAMLHDAGYALTLDDGTPFDDSLALDTMETVNLLAVPRRDASTP